MEPGTAGQSNLEGSRPASGRRGESRFASPRCGVSLVALVALRIPSANHGPAHNVCPGSAATGRQRKCFIFFTAWVKCGPCPTPTPNNESSRRSCSRTWLAISTRRERSAMRSSRWNRWRNIDDSGDCADSVAAVRKLAPVRGTSAPAPASWTAVTESRSHRSWLRQCSRLRSSPPTVRLQSESGDCADSVAALQELAPLRGTHAYAPASWTARSSVEPVANGICVRGTLRVV